MKAVPSPLHDGPTPADLAAAIEPQERSRAGTRGRTAKTQALDVDRRRSDGGRRRGSRRILLVPADGSRSDGQPGRSRDPLRRLAQGARGLAGGERDAPARARRPTSPRPAPPWHWDDPVKRRTRSSVRSHSTLPTPSPGDSASNCSESKTTRLEPRKSAGSRITPSLPTNDGQSSAS